MATTYYFGPTDSDITGQTGDYSKRLDDIAVGASTLFNVQSAAGSTEQLWGVTPAGVPGVNGGSGAQPWTVEFNIITGVSTMTLRVAVRRINSAGTTQVTSAFTSTQAATAGVKTFNLSNVDLGTWAAGDRLVIIYELTHPGGSHGTASIEFQMGTTNTEVIAPWSAPITGTVAQTLAGVSCAAAGTVIGDQPVVDTATGGQADAATSLTFAHTVADQANRVLCVGVQAAEETSTLSVTYNAVAMTSLGARNSNDQTLGKAQLFWMAAPAVGTNNVVVSSTQASDLEAESESLFNASQNQPTNIITAISATAAVSASIDTADANSLILGTVCCGDAIAAATSPTTSRRIENNNNLSAAGNGAIGDRTATGGIDAIGFERAAAEWWAIVAVEILPPAQAPTGTLAVTLAGVTASASGQLGYTGTVAATLAGATSAASGQLGYEGATAVTLAGVTCTATGTVGAGINGTLGVTLTGASAAATGQLGYTGTVSQTLAGATAASAGQLGYQGTLARTLAGATLAASGVVGTGIIGSLTATLAGATSTASGQLGYTGAAAVNLAGATAAASGTIINPVTGTAAITLAAATLTATGAFTPAPVIGTLAVILAGVTLDAAGGPPVEFGVNVYGSSTSGDARGSSSSGDAAGRTLVGVDVA